MIKINDIDLGTYGLSIKKNGCSGLHDLPSMKKSGVDWSDQNYTEASPRLIDCRYGTRVITFDCFVIGTSWDNLKSKLDSIKTALTYDGLKMLYCQSESNRGYLVYLSKTTIANPYTYFRGTDSASDFKLIFEEPQPFNIQFQWDARITSKNMQILISKATKVLSTESNKQRFIDVWLDGVKTEINLEHDDYEYSTTFLTGYHILIITGDIDTIELIQVNEDATGVTASANFLRNGTIEIIENPS